MASLAIALIFMCGTLPPKDIAVVFAETVRLRLGVGFESDEDAPRWCRPALHVLRVGAVAAELCYVPDLLCEIK